MAKDLIKTDVIPVSLYEDGCWWHKSKWQENDQHYNHLKKLLIEFYNNYATDHWLHSIIGKPMTIETLCFTRGCCNCCKTLYEVPFFTGKILIKKKKYKYDCNIPIWERFCESKDYSPAERNKIINDDQFLFDIEIYENIEPMSPYTVDRYRYYVSISKIATEITQFKNKLLTIS